MKMRSVPCEASPLKAAKRKSQREIVAPSKDGGGSTTFRRDNMGVRRNDGVSEPQHKRLRETWRNLLPAAETYRRKVFVVEVATRKRLQVQISFSSQLKAGQPPGILSVVEIQLFQAYNPRSALNCTLLRHIVLHDSTAVNKIISNIK